MRLAQPSEVLLVHVAFSRAATAACGLAVLFLAGCGETARLPFEAGVGPTPQLPPPNKTLIPTVQVAPATGWTDVQAPTPRAGFKVTALARGLSHPRWVYVLPNGDVLVAESNRPPRPEAGGGLIQRVRDFVAGRIMGRAGANAPSANRITLLRDTDGDGVAELRQTFLEGLNSPFGMALAGGDLVIANADALVKLPYQDGQTRATAVPARLTELPAGLNHHWTKNVLAHPDGRRLYVTVGSNSNVGENGLAIEEGRAAIWEVDVAGGAKRLFAGGLRNPNGLAWEPESGRLWTVVNERDEIGSDLVPDYLTSVQDGGFYGWPWSYWGGVVDVRVQPQRPDRVARALAPDYALGTHVAPLGLAFSHPRGMPPEFAAGAFVGQHGSWNRRPMSGYNVVFVPFIGGRPSGMPVEFLTGFLSADGQARGRPVGVALDRSGALLVADDVGNAVWRVAKER